MQKAIDNAHSNLEGLIHHSDRGLQYAYPSYITLLKDNNIKPSMTENGDPLENAVAGGTPKKWNLEIANFKPLRRKILSEPFSFERLQMDYKNMGHAM